MLFDVSDHRDREALLAAVSMLTLLLDEAVAALTDCDCRAHEQPQPIVSPHPARQLQLLPGGRSEPPS